MTRATLLMTTLLTTLSVNVAAQQTIGNDFGGPADDIKTFTELDGNSDGALTRDEVQQGDFDGDFSELDRNGDNAVNRNEYYQYYRDQSNQNR